MKDLVQDIHNLILSGYSLLYIHTWEEERALETLSSAAAAMTAGLVKWSMTEGFSSDSSNKTTDPEKALARIGASEGKIIFILKDFHAHLANPAVVRRLRDLLPLLADRGQALAIISPELVIPRELEKDMTVVELPLPDREELGKILDDALARLASQAQVVGPAGPEVREGMVRASLGLTAFEARRVFDRGLRAHPHFKSEHVEMILKEKKRILHRTELLEFYEVRESLSNVGGLDLLKKWLTDRAAAFSDEARNYGLPTPKGLLLLGVQGCGKSLCAKAVSSHWQMPLIRLDLAEVLGFSAHGSGESAMRRSIQIADSVAPCVLWIDEIEKGFSSRLVAGHAEEGSVSRAFATFLTWLQEKTEPVYVFATANSIEELPPELVRKGRFDEIFFVDLPLAHERANIFQIHLIKRGRRPEKFDLPGLAQASENFSGSEIEQAVISGMYEAFTSGREVSTADILKAAKSTVPLYETMQEKIQGLRDWAKTRARPASLDTKLMDLLNAR